MTHPLAPQRCADLTNAVERERRSSFVWTADDFVDVPLFEIRTAFRRYVEAVSDAIEHARRQYPGNWAYFADSLDRFVIPRPVDPLVEALNDAMPGAMGSAIRADIARDLREALEKRGLHITEIGRAERG